MKLLHILAQLPCGTGSGIYFSNLIKELAGYQHDQAAVFALQDNYTFEHLTTDRQYPVHFKTEELPFAVPGMSDVMPYDSTRYCTMTTSALELWTQAFRQTMEKAAAEFQPDFLILHHLWILSSLALEIFPESRSLGICHYTDLRQAMSNPELRKRYVNNIQDLDIILSLSDLHQDEIQAVHGCSQTRIVTMGGGFDSTLFYPAPNKKTGDIVRILYAGKIDPSKGVFALLQAFSSLRKQDQKVQLSIVGTPNQEYEGQLKELANSIGGIQLYPSLSQERLAQVMREHDVFALPSFFEGLGLIAVEALACGLWTVATEIEGLISLLGDQVNHSGIIEYVALPTMCPAGMPPSPQLSQFVSDLEMKLSLQIARCRRDNAFPENLAAEISRHSWAAMALKINALINAKTDTSGSSAACV